MLLLDNTRYHHKLNTFDVDIVKSLSLLILAGIIIGIAYATMKFDSDYQEKKHNLSQVISKFEKAISNGNQIALN